MAEPMVIDGDPVPTRTRAAVYVGLSVLGAGYPAFFHQVANLRSGFYGSVAPVNWTRVGVMWLVGLAFTGLIALLLWRLTNRSYSECLVPGTALVWGLAFFGRFHNGLGEVWELPSRLITVIIVVALTGVGWVGIRAMSSRGAADALVLAMAAPIGLTLIGASGLLGLPDIEPATHELEARAPSRDVWIVVLDAMPSPATVRGLGGATSELVEEMIRRGYQVPDDPRSAFTHTYPTLGSALSLQEIAPSEVVGPDEQGAWLAAMEGSHPVGEALTDAGYEFITVDNAFSFSRCGPLVTECLITPLTTEFEFHALINSAAVLWMPDTHPWTRHTMAQLDQMKELAQGGDGSPRLIYAHLLMPHKPFDYGADCQPFAGEIHGFMSATLSGFLETVSCLSDRLLELVQAIPDDDLVLIISDHGSDLRTGLDEFTGDQLRDRLSAFVAVKGCELDAEYLSSNVNAYRGFAGCLTTGSFPAWPAVANLTCTYTSGEVRFFDAQAALAAGDGMSCAEAG